MNKFLIILLGVLVFVPFKVRGAILQMESPLESIGIGEKLEIAVVFNPENDVINTVQAKLFLPQDKLEILDIVHGGVNSVLWLRKPQFLQNGNQWQIDFSAVAPGGVRGYLFSILTKPKVLGTFTDGQGSGMALLNDGLGTEKTLQILPATWQAAEKGKIKNEALNPDDRIPPEDFVPKIARDESIFEGKWFVVFHTTDQGLGVREYEVLETDFSESPEQQSGWEKAESPYLLKNQYFADFVFVKAIDKAGNTKIVQIVLPTAKKYPVGYAKLIIWSIILLIAIVVIWRFLKKRFFPSAHHFFNDNKQK